MSETYIKFSFIFLFVIVQPSRMIFADYIQAKIYNYKPHHRIKTHIGTKSQNRINFGNYGIREIIGDDNLYQLIHDSNGHNIFILPKAPAGAIIDITLVSNSNKIQDLSLEVMDDFGQTIIICSDIIREPSQ